MTIELPREVASRLQETAQAQGVSVGQYLERLVAETDLRRSHLAEFRAAIAERMASLKAGYSADGEEVMARLIAELPLRRAGTFLAVTCKTICRRFAITLRKTVPIPPAG